MVDRQDSWTSADMADINLNDRQDSWTSADMADINLNDNFSASRDIPYQQPLRSQSDNWRNDRIVNYPNLLELSQEHAEYIKKEIQRLTEKFRTKEKLLREKTQKKKPYRNFIIRGVK